MARELFHRGPRIEDMDEPAWIYNLTAKEKENVEKGRSGLASGPAALFLNPYVTVGVSGEWGMGKFSLMLQTESGTLIMAAQQAFPDGFMPFERFPRAKRVILNTKGGRMHQKGRKAVQRLVGADKLTDLGEKKLEPMAYLLEECRLEYDAVLKALACIDCNDIFLTGDGKSVPGGAAILTVRYNAWHYKSKYEAWAGLAVKISEEMEATMTIGRFKYGSVPATLTEIVWVVVKSVMSVLKAISNQMSLYITLADHSECPGYQQKVIGLVGHTVIPKMKPAFEDNLRIIVFFDDLDRCHDKITLKCPSCVEVNNSFDVIWAVFSFLYLFF